ncbi:MAG: permease, partial [Ketobacter sp.]
VLFGQGVTFAGVMAFIFSDLVVLPVLRINARYYGWKMALYLLALMWVAIVIAALVMHYALAYWGMLPDYTAVTAPADREYFKLNYQLVLNVVLLAINGVLIWLWYSARHGHHHHHHDNAASLTDRVLSVLVVVALVWLSGGLLVALL